MIKCRKLHIEISKNRGNYVILEYVSNYYFTTNVCEILQSM